MDSIMFVEVEARNECERVSESDRKNSGGTVGMVDAGLPGGFDGSRSTG